MALLKANGIGILDGSTISMPLIGVWIADLIIDQPDGSGFNAGDKVSIVADDGLTLSGIVDPSRTGSYLNAVHIRVLGGAGGTNVDITPQGFAQPGAKINDVLNTMNNDSKEVLSADIDSAILSTNLVAWSLISVPYSHALVTLINHAIPGANWRILPDGSLWIGKDTFPNSSPKYVIITNDPKEGIFELGVESPSIAPGVFIDGIGNINKVEHKIEKNAIRTTVWIELDQQEDRGIRASIAEMVRQEVNGIDYFTLYDAKVVTQSGDLSTVDLIPLDPRFSGTNQNAGLQRVPLRVGLPGTKVQFSNGAIVRLGWDRGNPSMPYACLWNGGETVQSIEIAGTRRVARLDDTVNLGSFQLNGVGNAFSQIAWTPPGGGTPVNITVSPGAELTGKIDNASTVVKVA